MILIISDSGNHIRSRTEYTGLSSTHPNIILWFEELSSLNLKYVYTKVVFDGDKCEDDFLWNNQHRCFFPLPQYTLSWSSTSLSLDQCHFINHVFELLIFMPKLINPFVFELSILGGVAGCFWCKRIKYGYMPISVLHYWMYRTFHILLLKTPPCKLSCTMCR